MQGFKEFILRGNVIELAVAVIIGAAFKTIVDKFVEALVQPFIAFAVGAPNFDDALIIPLGGDGAGLQFGVVLTAVINFLLVAFVIYFCMVKPMNILMERMKKKEEEPEPAPEEKPADVALLEEIRDLLKKQQA